MIETKKGKCRHYELSLGPTAKRVGTTPIRYTVLVFSDWRQLVLLSILVRGQMGSRPIDLGPESLYVGGGLERSWKRALLDPACCLRGVSSPNNIMVSEACLPPTARQATFAFMDKVRDFDNVKSIITYLVSAFKAARMIETVTEIQHQFPMCKLYLVPASSTLYLQISTMAARESRSWAGPRPPGAPGSGA